MTGKEFADLCAAQAGQAYVWGGLGYALSESRLNQLKKLYPEIYTAAYISKIRKYLNKPVFDCVGLVKFFLWGNTEPGRLIKYAINGIPDTSANGLYNLCAEKGDIKDLPELPGLLLHRDGHVGIYLGGGKLIEARGVDYGVVISEVAKRDFRHWGKLPGIDYTVPEKIITVDELINLLHAQGITGIKI
jgi:cell wall-associated NlpC family hydrolase